VEISWASLELIRELPMAISHENVVLSRAKHLAQNCHAWMSDRLTAKENFLAMPVKNLFSIIVNLV
jgi:hypothetical protein